MTEQLTVAELKQLTEERDAARVRKGADERFDRNGWTVVITHHVPTGGHWSATAWRAGTCYSGERCLYVGDSEEECRTMVGVFLASGAK